jgi:hypothetical protein
VRHFITTTLLTVIKKRARIISSGQNHCSILVSMSHNSLAVCGTAIWLLCLCSLAEASIDGGDETGDGPSVWQYIVIALALAFVFMTGKLSNAWF